ncbi:hypothetical protein ABZV65_22415 [Streptomyces bauhiniae]|uniref:hypothetical protein n=1 Tax=Streptomyces bauhiniae TaxID=2340725 RepID=UPI0033A22583
MERNGRDDVPFGAHDVDAGLYGVVMGPVVGEEADQVITTARAEVVLQDPVGLGGRVGHRELVELAFVDTVLSQQRNARGGSLGHGVHRDAGESETVDGGPPDPGGAQSLTDRVLRLQQILRRNAAQLVRGGGQQPDELVGHHRCLSGSGDVVAATAAGDG